ncbi:MAG: succinate--CoA ligase subunit alpha [Thermoproteota archaeon]|nr:MAG: succinate--CoA ligase subunit alpha [Candidatus Korarchaeota archaeon]
MAILVDEGTRVIVQGITGREGSFHTKLMLDYGTRIVAGVTPGKGGSEVHGVPVYDSVEEALSEHDANASIIFVPARFASDAAFEAIEAGLNPVVVITEHIPIMDALKFVSYARDRGINVVGPNCPGVISPARCKLGVMPAHVFEKGIIGMVSRSGTLTYEIAWAITKAGLGESTCVGIGGDPVIGMDFIEVVEMFQQDPQTEAVVVIGEIGGDFEERLAAHVRREKPEKPIVAYIAGRTAPPGKRMGHAGAIVTMGAGSAESKIKALREAGIPVADLPSQVPELILQQLRR